MLRFSVLLIAIITTTLQSACAQIPEADFRTLTTKEADNGSRDSERDSLKTHVDYNSRPKRLKEIFDQSRQKGRFEAVSSNGVEQFEKLLRQTIESDDPLQFENTWLQLDWQLQRVNTGRQTVLVLNEIPTARQGRGLYLINETSESSLVFQSPHRFFDQHTGIITFKTLTEHDFRAAAWNTVHRREIDIAHSPDHYLNAFTRVLLATTPQALFVQIHGFSGSKFSADLSATRMIVSDGTRHPTRCAHLAALVLKEHFSSESVRLYPLEIQELGGTTNSQRHQLTALGSVGFLHLELHPETRNALKKSKEKRAQLFDALAKSASTLQNQ